VRLLWGTNYIFVYYWKDISYGGSVTAQSLTPFTTEVQDRSQAGQRQICGGQSGTGTGLSPSTPVSPVSTIPPMLHTYPFIFTPRLSEGRADEAWEASRNHRTAKCFHICPGAARPARCTCKSLSIRVWLSAWRRESDRPRRFDLINASQGCWNNNKGTAAGRVAKHLMISR
jgi:hypothetical protein